MAQAQENIEGGTGPGEVNGRRSEVWNHFISSKDADGKDIAICRTCEKTYGASTKNGTTHLKRHVDKGCTRPQKQPRISSLQGGSSNSTSTLPESSLAQPADEGISWYNQEACGAELARMIAYHGYPSSIVEDVGFRSFVSCLNPHFQMPSRAAVENSCRRHAEDATKQLKETLARCSAQISLAAGTADTGQGKALYMACQFVDDEWILQKRILQVFIVVPFPPYNHGALLGVDEVSIELNEGILEQLSLAKTSGMLEGAARCWGLPGRLFSVAWGQELEAHLERKDFLDDLCPFVRVGEGQIEIPLVSSISYTSDALNSVADAIFSKLSTYFQEDCFKALKGLCMDQEKRARYFSELGLNHVGRYDKRWYSFFCALEVLHKEYSDNNNAAMVEPPALSEDQLREVLGRSRLRDRQVRELLGLSRFKENQLTELLRKILGVIYRGIETISSPPGRPTSNLCLMELMKLRAVLQSEEIDARQDVSKAVSYARIGGFGGDKDVNAVLLGAKGVLDKFLKEAYLYLSVPSVLDPRFKLEYVAVVLNVVFESEADAYISRVKERIGDIFNEHRRKLRSSINGEGTSSMAAGIGAAAMEIDGYSQEGITELERYLTDGLVPPGEEGEFFDILLWWKANSSRYPTVASMARDALAMPASDMLSPEHIARIRSMMSNCCITYP